MKFSLFCFLQAALIAVLYASGDLPQNPRFSYLDKLRRDVQEQEKKLYAFEEIPQDSEGVELKSDAQVNDLYQTRKLEDSVEEDAVVARKSNGDNGLAKRDDSAAERLFDSGESSSGEKTPLSNSFLVRSIISYVKMSSPTLGKLIELIVQTTELFLRILFKGLQGVILPTAMEGQKATSRIDPAENYPDVYEPHSRRRRTIGTIRIVLSSIFNVLSPSRIIRNGIKAVIEKVPGFEKRYPEFTASIDTLHGPLEIGVSVIEGLLRVGTVLISQRLKILGFLLDIVLLGFQIIKSIVFFFTRKVRATITGIYKGFGRFFFGIRD